MHLRKFPKARKLAFILITSIPTLAQQPAQGAKQTATNSSCSNILALVGNISLNCSSLTPAQSRLLASIPKVLEKILANQLDPDAVMEKLDEILKVVNPNAPKRTYLLNGGSREVFPGGSNLNPDPHSSFSRMSELENAKDWSALIILCERVMQETPAWYTPYALAGRAYAHLGQKQKALELLKKAEDGIAENPDYGSLPDLVRQLITEVNRLP